MAPLPHEEIRAAVRAALAEDIGSGDVTTLATVPESALIDAAMVAREPLVVAGLAFAEETFRQVAEGFPTPDLPGDAQVGRVPPCMPPGSDETTARKKRARLAHGSFNSLVKDGQALKKGAALLRIRGSARAILTAERVALNFVQRLSGVASLTAQFVAAVHGTRAQILDTRKTTPGWRRFEKYAVACGGGRNHRFGLFDLVLIKDNHLAALRDEKPNAIAAAVQRARLKYPQQKVEVEADTLRQVRQAVAAGADIILLDNMTNDQLRAAVKLAAGHAQTEASGGVNLQTVRGIAGTGVDFISVGALTHSDGPWTLPWILNLESETLNRAQR